MSPAAHERFVQRYIERSSGLPLAEIRQFVLSQRSRHLRTFVDAWLETGVHEDGSESPFDRDLSRALTVFPAVVDYWDKYGEKVSFSPTTSGLSLIIGDVPYLPPEKNNPFEGPPIEALRFFTATMVSDWKERLCKCRYCGRYFLHKKPRRHPYVRGLFCSRKHQQFVSAATCIREGRLELRTKLVEIAAKRLLDRLAGPSWHEDPTQRSTLAAFLRRTPTCRRLTWMIQRNWVSHNHRAIEEKRLELSRLAPPSAKNPAATS